MQTAGADPLAAEADLLVVPVGSALTGPAAALDAALGGLVAACMGDGEVDGKPGSLTIVHSRGAVAARRIAVVGIGEGDRDGWRQAGRAAGDRARALRAARVVLAAGDADAERVTAALAGLSYGAYRYEVHRTAPATPPVESVTVCGGGADEAAVARAGLIGAAVSAARDLANAPANVLTPTVLAERAASLADDLPGLECRIHDEGDLRRMGAGALLGVARGSAEAPRMIELRWTPPGGRGGDGTLGLVGKAVTFDTGGISIKPAAGMEEMKMDMAGGGAVVEAMGLIARMGVAAPVVAVVPSAENMPGGSAVKPGDVLRAMDGTTIEVTNTDAEGRLLLADALHHAVTACGATRLVDFATLTGAIVVALGEVYAGLFGSDPDWTEAVRAAGEASGDLCWPMPMHRGYAAMIESRVADVVNSTTKRQAGAVTAAQFLRRFTSDVPWCHVDIAGTGMVSGAGTGFGVGLMLHLAEAMVAA